MKKNILLILISISLSCSNQNKNKSNEWINLFDGSSLDGWRAYNGDQMPPGWKIVDSVLTFNTKQILERIMIIKEIETLCMGMKNLKILNFI